jgi:hypothetical protein
MGPVLVRRASSWAGDQGGCCPVLLPTAERIVRPSRLPLMTFYQFHSIRPACWGRRPATSALRVASCKLAITCVGQEFALPSPAGGCCGRANGCQCNHREADKFSRFVRATKRGRRAQVAETGRRRGQLAGRIRPEGG